MAQTHTDEAIVLNAKIHGNSGFIVKLFTREHGVISGFLKSCKQPNLLLPGVLIHFSLTKRLDEHMGVLTLEQKQNFPSLFIKNRLKHTILLCVCESLYFLTQEGMEDSELFANTLELFTHVNAEERPAELLKKYILFELSLLKSLGLQPNLEECSVSGARQNLAFISPNTGNTVTREIGLPYSHKLLEIPGFFFDPLKPVEHPELAKGWNITTKFLLEAHGFERATTRGTLSKFIT